MSTISDFTSKAHKYSIQGRAYLAVEGGGINGIYTIRGSVAVVGNFVTVSAMGFTPMMVPMQSRDSVHFFARAALVQQGREMVRTQLTKNEAGLWPNDEYVPIGSAMIKIPSYLQGKVFSVLIEGGYEFRTGHGTFTPLPPSVRTFVELPENG